MKIIEQNIHQIEIFLKELIQENQIINYQILLRSNMSLELKLLVKEEIDEESIIFKYEEIKKIRNAVSISQFIEKEYEDEFIEKAFNGTNKINYNLRRRYSELINPKHIEVDIPVVTFYSYKGGMGRTTTLACYAAYMAMFHNKKVVIVDCDFEAPGFSNGNYFFLDLGEDNEKIKCGVAEYLLDKEFLEHLGERPSLKDYSYDEINVAGSADDSFTKKGEMGEGEIFIIPAGKLSQTNINQYMEAISRIDLSNNFQGFINDIATDFGLTKDNGLILFDSRTGFNDTFAAISKFSQIIVGIFGINKQNEPGIEFFINHFINSEKKLLFVRGMADSFTENEEPLKQIIEKIIRRKSEEPLSYELSYIENNIRELQYLGTEHLSKKAFRDFLLKTEFNDKANLSDVFKKITKFIEKTDVKKKVDEYPDIEIIIDTHTENFKNLEVLEKMPIEKKIGIWKNTLLPQNAKFIKKQLLEHFKQPNLSATNYVSEELEKDFYFRVPMHDIFHKRNPIIWGSKGSGKTFLYRILDEKHPHNIRILRRLAKFANKNIENYIFVNILEPEMQTGASIFIHKYNKRIDDFSKFWQTYTHYSIFKHPSIQYLISEKKTKYKNLDLVNNNDLFSWLDFYIDKSSGKILSELFSDIVYNFEQLNIDLEANHKFLLFSYDQLDFEIPVNFWREGITPLVDYLRFIKYTRFIPKIFIRRDLFHRINITNVLELTKNSINLEWTKLELFAHFFKIFLNSSEKRDLFYQYLMLYFEKDEKIFQLIKNIDQEFSEFNQLLLDEQTIRKLVEPSFGKRADFSGNDEQKFTDCFDWFYDNLQDASGQINLRSFWTLIDEAVKKEKINKKNHYSLIPPYNFMDKGIRILASRAYFDELSMEAGNKGLDDFLKFFETDFDLDKTQRVYQYKNKEFVRVIELFIKKYPSNISFLLTAQTNEEHIQEVIKWLIANGIIIEEKIEYGKYINYIFPYFYRGLFQLQPPKYSFMRK